MTRLGAKTKKGLGKLSSGAKEDIAEIAAKIEEGAYEKRKPATPPVKNGGTANVKEPTDNSLISTTDSLYSEFRQLAITGDPAELKTSLKAFISKLEELCSSL